jgi:hypothetical protein
MSHPDPIAEILAALSAMETCKNAVATIAHERWLEIEKLRKLLYQMRGLIASHPHTFARELQTAVDDLIRAASLEAQ